MEDKYTDVMSEISVKNSLINHLERENIKLKNEYNIAQDGITDLNDVLKDMQEESKEQIKENKRLQAEIDRLNKSSNLGNDYMQYDYVHMLERENNELKHELNKTKCGGINQ